MAKKVKITPERKQEFIDKGTQNTQENTGADIEKPKRTVHRRTRAEIDAEKNTLSDSGYELIADFMKLLSDNDSVKYKLPKQPRSVFEPLSKQYSSIINYFMPMAKPIYFACASAAVGSIMMLKERSDLISKSLKENGNQQPGEKGSPNIGKARSGEVFPSETKPVKI